METLPEPSAMAPAGAAPVAEDQPLISISPQVPLENRETGNGTGAVSKRQYNIFPPLDVAGAAAVPPPPAGIFSRPQSVAGAGAVGPRSGRGSVLLERFELGNPDASPPPKSKSLHGSSRSLRTPLNTGRRDIEFIDTQTPGGQWCRM